MTLPYEVETYYMLSSETKPELCADGSVLNEIDTGKTYVKKNNVWIEVSKLAEG